MTQPNKLSLREVEEYLNYASNFDTIVHRITKQLADTMREVQELKKRLGMAHPDFDNTYKSPLHPNKNIDYGLATVKDEGGIGSRFLTQSELNKLRAGGHEVNLVTSGDGPYISANDETRYISDWPSPKSKMRCLEEIERNMKSSKDREPDVCPRCGAQDVEHVCYSKTSE